MKNVWYYDFPIGKIWIAENDGAISHVLFGEGSSYGGYELAETPLIQKAAGQLKEYFDGKRTEFDLPLSPQGTEFQQRVWDALETIPFGETRSYKDIAALIGKPRAARAVGMANNKNPIAILIPCHRVVGYDGRLVGYAGGIPTKKYLLELEKRHT